MFYYSSYYQYHIIGPGDIHVAPHKLDPAPAAGACCLVLLKYMCFPCVSGQTLDVC